MNGSSRRPWLLILAFTTAMGGCGATPRSDTATVRDSAGVRLVLSTRPVWTEQDAWRLDPSPDPVIGTSEGPAEYELSWIWDATRLASGGIIVGVAGAHELRWYDSAGVFIRRAGRKGSGPGEFGDATDLRMWSLPQGQVAVRDVGASRVNVFDTAGAFVRTILLTPPAMASRPTLIGTFADGGLLALAWAGDGAVVPGKVTRTAVRYLRYGGDGTPTNEISRADNAPRYTHSVEGATHFPFLPLTTEPVAVADSASVLVLRNGDPVVERYDASGRLIARYAWQPERQPVTPEFYRRYADAQVATASNPVQKRLYQAYYALDLPLPDTAPSSTELHVDDTRHIWVERFRFPGAVERTWDILDPEGRWLGVVTFPGRFWFHRAGRDYLLGTSMDSLDVERVELHRLVRP